MSARTCFGEYTYLFLQVRVLKICKYVVLSGDFSRSLYKLRLKFEETTRVVCTDFAEVLRIGSVLLVFILCRFNFRYVLSFDPIQRK